MCNTAIGLRMRKAGVFDIAKRRGLSLILLPGDVAEINCGALRSYSALFELCDFMPFTTTILDLKAPSV